MGKLSNVILVGPMGAGKTTIGRIVARELKRPFHDSDREVEARTGVAIPLIFDVEGEAGFRNREVKAIDELTSLGRIVLATGGGAVLRQENRTRLRERGFVVYLRAPLEHLIARTRRDRNRPLLREQDPARTLARIVAEREPLYREVADLIVDTGNRTVKTVARDICRTYLSLCESSQSN